MKKLVVKIGGAAMDRPELLTQCATAIAAMAADGNCVAVVHGGGAALTRTLQRLGKKSEFMAGLRVTDADTRDVALMVLAGVINKSVVAALARCGQPAIGMSGGDGLAFRARRKKVPGNEHGFVGEIASTDARWIQSIWSMGGVPVMSSIALGYDGEYYNVNADEMAAACASACGADALIFLTDVAGVKDADGEIIRWLSAQRIQSLTDGAVVTGGMLPKLHACEQALRGGVGRVRILAAQEADVLPGFYRARIHQGTEVIA